MALGLHLEHPPPRSVSLQRSKEIRLLSNQRYSVTGCPVPDSFLSCLEPSPPTSCPPRLCSGWTTISQDMVDVLDFDIREFASPIQDEGIPLPSTPSTPRFPPPGSTGMNKSFESEGDEDIDIQIPLMTSLFYDDGGFTISFPRDRHCKILPHRDETVCSESQTFPRDVDTLSTWGFSPSPTPRPTTPCFSPSSTSLSLDSNLPIQPTTNQPSSAFIQPLSVAHELLRFQSKRRKQLARPRNGSDSPSRRLPRPPFSEPDVTLVKRASTSQLGTLASPSIDGTTRRVHPPKPKSRPLPPTPTTPPKPIPLMKVAACNFGSSFLNLSSPCGVVHDRVSIDLDGLVDIVDDMICNQRLSSFTIGEIGSMDPVLPLRRRRTPIGFHWQSVHEAI